MYNNTLHTKNKNKNNNSNNRNMNDTSNYGISYRALNKIFEILSYTEQQENLQHDIDSIWKVTDSPSKKSNSNSKSMKSMNNADNVDYTNVEEPIIPTDPHEFTYEIQSLSSLIQFIL